MKKKTEKKAYWDSNSQSSVPLKSLQMLYSYRNYDAGVVAYFFYKADNGAELMTLVRLGDKEYTNYLQISD